MQEAFRKAAEEAARKAEAEVEVTPGLQIAANVADSMVKLTQEEVQRLARERRYRETNVVKNDYRKLGHSWETLRLLMPANMHWARFRVIEDEVRDDWRKAHELSLRLNLTIPERAETLMSLANGMNIIEGIGGLYSLYYANLISKRNLIKYQLRGMIGEAPSYSPVSQILMHAVCDLANFNSDQQSNFYEHMYDKKLRRGKFLDLLESKYVLAEYIGSM